DQQHAPHRRVVEGAGERNGQSAVGYEGAEHLHGIIVGENVRRDRLLFRHGCSRRTSSSDYDCFRAAGFFAERLEVAFAADFAPADFRAGFAAAFLPALTMPTRRSRSRESFDRPFFRLAICTLALSAAGRGRVFFTPTPGMRPSALSSMLSSAIGIS